MKLDNDTTNGIDDLYQNYWEFHSAMMDRGHSPLEVAAVLVAQSMSIYKTVLDASEYDKMVDSISDMRYNVKEIKPQEGNYH